MSAPSGDVIDRLERLAAHAPVRGLDPDAAWTRGRRRQRLHQVAVAASIVLLAGLGAVVAAPLARLADPPVAATPSRSGPRLPDVIREPGGWEPAFGKAPGPLAAVGTGERSGWLSSTPALWGVSAVTGESRFLDLPGAAGTDAALNPAGTRLAYWVTEGEAGAPGVDGRRATTGVAIRDLTTGDESRWDAATQNGMASGELVWSGNTLWIRTGAFDDADRTSYRDATWTWSGVGDPRPSSSTTGRFTLLGAQSLPNGLVLNNGAGAKQIRMIIGETPSTPVRLVTEGSVSTPVVSPDGRLVAGVAQPPRTINAGMDLPLVVGTIAGREAAMEPLSPVEAEQVLGWRSNTVAVVGSSVDEDGDEVPDVFRASTVSTADLEVAHLFDVVGNLPLTFAADVWAGDVVEAPPAPFAPDPRLLAACAAMSIVFCVSLWREVRRRRGHP